MAGSRNNGEHSDCMQSLLASQASLAEVFSWLKFRRQTAQPAERPKQTKLTVKLADAEHTDDMAGGCMAERWMEVCERGGRCVSVST